MGKTNNKESGFSAVEGLLVLVIVAIVGFTGWYVYNANKKTSNYSADTQAAAAHAQPLSIKGQAIADGSYYELDLGSYGAYFGKVQPIDSNYVRLFPVFYTHQETDGSYSLIALGNEVHQPEPVMYVYKSAITKVTKLMATDQAYKVITGYTKTNKITVSDAYPATNINAYVKPAQYRAFFFDDGKVYFSKLSSVHKLPFKTGDVVYDLKGDSQNVTLQKVDAGQLSKYSESHLVFWENLKATSQVAQGITKKEAATP